jgi:hypothetical protein
MDVAARIGRLTGSAVRDLRRIGGQHRCGHYRVMLSDGRLAFAKVAAADLGADRAASSSQKRAAALACRRGGGARSRSAWLGHGRARRGLAATGSPDAAAASQFGRDLARLHLGYAAGFGAPWPGFIASLPLGTTARTPQRPVSADPRW